jgi:predicted esterase
MALTGLWVSKYGYQVTDASSGKTETIYIMGAEDEMADPVHLQELEHFAQESVVRSWKREKPMPHTIEQRKDLGEALRGVHDSHKLWADTLHGRYY